MNPQKPYWTSTEAAVWKDFLGTETGKRLLRFLAEAEPALLTKGETNEILIRAGQVRQHKEILSDLLDLTGGIEIQPEDDVVDNFPSLYDDNKWDGKKLQEPE